MTDIWNFCQLILESKSNHPDEVRLVYKNWEVGRGGKENATSPCLKMSIMNYVKIESCSKVTCCKPNAHDSCF